MREVVCVKTMIVPPIGLIEEGRWYSLPDDVASDLVRQGVASYKEKEVREAVIPACDIPAKTTKPREKPEKFSLAKNEEGD